MLKMLTSCRGHGCSRLPKPQPAVSGSGCAANLCAVLAAILLLISVSVLHSRLGFELNKSQVRSFSSFRLGFPTFTSGLNDRNPVNGVEYEQKLKDRDFGKEVGEEEEDRLDSSFEIEDSGESGEEIDDRIDAFDDFEDIDSGSAEDFVGVDEGQGKDKLNSSSGRLSGSKQVGKRSGRTEIEFESEEKREEIHKDARKGTVGYFWDHVAGVTRRAFSKKWSAESGFEGWEDDDFFDFVSSANPEDKSKLAFSSDDQPVDEGVRNKLGEIKQIEDAFLLKRGGGASALRAGWAPWFDNVQKRSSKGDFLRRDRMFRSNLDLLNPLNNPLLQDPDGPGLTVLTRGDKLIQRTMMSELEKTPFGGEKAFQSREKIREFKQVAVKMQKTAKRGYVDGDSKAFAQERIVGNAYEKYFNEIAKSRAAFVGAERRTLDDFTGDNSDQKDHMKSSDSIDLTRKGNIGFESDQLPTDRVVEQSIPTNLRTEERLPPKEKLRENLQSFSDLGMDTVKPQGNLQQSQEIKRGLELPMDPKQLNSEAQNKIRMKHHHKERWGYFPGLDRHLPFLEFMDQFFRHEKCSLRVFMVWNTPPWTYSVRHQRGLESLLFHHRNACIVVFSETIELEFFHDFVKDGYKIAVVMPNLDELLKDTPTHIFASVWHEWRKVPLYSIHYSELVRLAALYKYGGLYIDSDIIVLKPLPFLSNSVGVEDQPGGKVTLNGAVMAFKRNSPFIMECLKEFYSTYDDSLLRWNGADLLTRTAERVSESNDAHKQLELKMEPPFAFFPISSQNIIRYFAAPANETDRALQESLFRRILDKSLAFHFWNSLTSALVPEPGSLVERVINHHCLRCLDTL